MKAHPASDELPGPAAPGPVDPFLHRVSASLEAFLELWGRHMGEAGYLLHTTAKREDCIVAFREVLGAVARACPDRAVPSFARLLDDLDQLAEFTVATARNHRCRGVTAEMFLGCFKTLLHSIEDIVEELDLSAEDKWRGLLRMRRVCDALETAFVGDWDRTSEQEESRLLKEAQRRLTLEKNKYENIYAATSDLVLIADRDGRVVEANPSIRRHLAGRAVVGEPLWRVLDTPCGSVPEFLRRYPPDAETEVTLGDGRCVFTLRVVPLNRVSLASQQFIVILNEVTRLVDHRRELERRVVERSVALANSEKMLRSIFQSVGHGILVVDAAGTVVRANHRASEIYGVPLGELVGRGVTSLTDARGRALFRECLEGVAEGQSRSAEITGVCADGTTFPSEITVNQIDVDEVPFWPVIVRDISAQTALEEHLRREKLRTEEMNVTLRNVMRSIDQERRDFERSISRKVKTNLLPALHKARVETVEGIRSSYLDLVEEQLGTLTESLESDVDARLLKLSRAELWICDFIKAGSTTKEICETLNLSFETVQTHRKNIRRKLGLRGKGINLHAFLSRRSHARAQPVRE